MRSFLKLIWNLSMAAAVAACIYLLAWPVPIIPEAWEAPPDQGYTGSFARNDRLKGFEYLPLAGQRGPEAMAIDSQGRLYVSTRGGWIMRFGAGGGAAQPWYNTGGQPLGLAFHPNGNLIVADADKGLLAVTPRGDAKRLINVVGGKQIGYANDVDIARDGRIFFTDASTKFAPALFGHTYEAALFDLMEHGGHGRLIVYDPATDKARELIKKLNFANGVALSPDQRFVLVAETGNYRILRYWLEGEKKGQSETLIDNLPGFPDNLSAGRDGRFWLALAAPRNRFLDATAPWPIVRKIAQRLPKQWRPKAKLYGHVIAFDENGMVLLDLQDPQGRYPVTTSAREDDRYVYVGSLRATRLARLPKAALGL